MQSNKLHVGGTGTGQLRLTYWSSSNVTIYISHTSMSVLHELWKFEVNKNRSGRLHFSYG